MQVDDRDQLAAVWLVDGPGPEAVWPLSLAGMYAEHRDEWYFPKGTRVDAILRASGVDHRRDDKYEATNGYPALADEGLFDPLIEEVDEHGVEAEADDSPRMQAVARAVQAWTDQLIDRSARNNLLFFRDQRAGTLDLTKTPPRPLFDILVGRSRHLAQLFPADEDALAEAARRSRTINNKAQAIYEERGIHTLYLACGLATWDNQHGTAEPAAPILLAPATLTARGAAQQNFDLQVTGELEVNPTLLNALAAEFAVDCDPEELLASAGMQGAIDTPEELEIAYGWLARKAAQVPGFAVREKTVLGNFSYAKLPMVRDLQGSVEALAGHDLIAALAGDAEARQAVRDRRVEVDPTLPDQTPPVDEFLVLDADSSQNFAINKVLCGQDLVIKGPPGTGKSQTISNLIACLVARGQTVLFVAEKRAAIDAVLKRLEQVGLHDLVLDLHGGVSSKRQVAQSLAHALHTNATIAEPELSHEHQRLEARRRELNDWQAALHEKREPWGLSLFAAEERLLALDEEAETDVRLRGQKLHALTADGLERAREQLRDFVGLGGLHATSAFFIKNLERVQGDERDAIILTVGYGKGADGQMVYRFGPLNEEGGERRLNVAVTRARRRMTAVSSFTPADMDPEKTRRGGDLLRLYLAYAESCGEKLDRQAAEAPELNAFELDIRDALVKAGIPLICQHGVGRYRLDFAAKHPDRPGRLVLAIEADGASYHSAETARDRDRLRQEQLERLGWRFHRIWSQDWLTERGREIDKAVAAYRAAVSADDAPTAVAPTPTALAPPSVIAASRGKERTPRPGVRPWGEIDEFTDRDLQAMVRWIESDTLLRSREDLIAEAMSELGFERRGKKIVRRIGAAIDAVRAQPRT